MISAVYFTVGSKKDADKIAEALVKEKLVVCANIFPVSSIYWWKNKIERGKEFVVWTKCKSENFRKIVKRVKELHSYKLPAIEKIDVETYPEVEKWVNGYS